MGEKGLKKTEYQEKKEARERRKTVFFRARALEDKPVKSQADYIRTFLYGLLALFVLGIAVGIIAGLNVVSGSLMIIPFFMLFMGVGIFVFRMELTNLADYSKKINKMPFFDGEDSQKKRATGIIETFKSPVYNSPLPYHLSLVVLTLVSLIFYQGQDVMVNDEFYSRFTADIIFQLVAGLLFIILGLFNPALKVPEKTKRILRKNKGIINQFILDERKFFIFRIVFCLSVIALFVFNKWLFFPPLNTNNPVLVGITVTLILFVVRNIYMMGRYPQIFLKENLFRSYKVITLLKGAFFILIPFVPFSMIMGLGEEISSTVPILFMGFNLIAAYMEYALIKGIESVDS